MIPEQFNLDEILRTSENISKKYQRSIVSENDVVICLRGDTGLTRLVPRELEGANLTQGTARISLNTDMNPSYVMWMFHSKQLRREIQRYMKGSTFKEISLTDLRKVKFPVVQKELQDKWSILIDDLHANWIRTQERSDNFRCLSSNLIDFYSSSEVKS